MRHFQWPIIQMTTKYLSPSGMAKFLLYRRRGRDDQNAIPGFGNDVGAHFDGGFYNMVFHPNFGQAGKVGRNYFFAYYSTPSLTGAHDGPTPQRCYEDALFDGSYLVLRRYEVIEGTLVVDESKTLDMFKIRLYNSTHRGGGMVFGKDGFCI